jgi:hypothetical protein
MKRITPNVSKHSNLMRHLSAFTPLLVLLLSCGNAFAQSNDIEFPTPVRDNIVNGTIPARDIGDARLTRHFYALTGTQGDLTVTVEYKNLDGDVDLFTKGTLRTLKKISMYFGESSTTTSQTVFLRQSESLILRVEARTLNENEGSYRIRFDGAFEPIKGDVPTLEQPASAIPSSTNTDKNVRRVTSSGARIEEPKTEIASQPPTETPAETPATEVAREANPAPEPPKRVRPPRPSIRRTPRAPSTPPRAATVPPSARKKKTPPPLPTVEDTAAAASPSTVPEATLTASPRLIIETRDGMRVERFMNTVRRVTVENGQVIIITKSGKVERQPLTSILRMSIEP